MFWVSGFCLAYVYHFKDLENELRDAVLQPVLAVSLLDDVVRYNRAFFSYHYIFTIYMICGVS